MRVLVTGATGFAGRWLIRELEAVGHEAIPTPPRSILDISDRPAVAAFISSVAPHAIVHLAGMAYGPDAKQAPLLAARTNIGGTQAVLAGAATVGSDLPTLIVSSSEVYGHPLPSTLPLDESAELRAHQPYGQSKVAMEQVAFEAAARGHRRIAIVRPFNHTGPGQRMEFVVPALALRVLIARTRDKPTITAGNIDVRRDFTDVRDVVRAYRLIIEEMARGQIGANRWPLIYNIASGRSVAIRDIAMKFGAMAGLPLDISTDPELARPDDPPDIRGDASRIAAEIGWRPEIPFDVTLRDVFADVIERRALTA